MNILIEQAEAYPALLTLLGLLAALVSLITEITKNIGWLRRIPTDLQVIALAEALSLLTLLAWSAASGAGLSWYLLAASLVGGLLVAFVAMYGWATWFDLLERFDHKQAQAGRKDDE